MTSWWVECLVSQTIRRETREGMGNSHFVKSMADIPDPQMPGAHSTSLRAGLGHPARSGAGQFADCGACASEVGEFHLRVFAGEEDAVGSATEGGADCGLGAFGRGLAVVAAVGMSMSMPGQRSVLVPSRPARARFVSR